MIINNKYLENKTKEEIEFAAVPEGVFMLSSTTVTDDDVTDDDVKRAEGILNILCDQDNAVENFPKAAKSNSEFFRNT